MAWKKGPLPPKTYGWGGVVPCDDADTPQHGFCFANFQGDKVVVLDGTSLWKTLKPHEVAAYDNSLECPPDNF
jgi:hypothetical protein